MQHAAHLLLAAIFPDNQRDPAPPRGRFLDSAEPLTAWRVELPDLIDLIPASDPRARARSRSQALSTASEPG